MNKDQSIDTHIAPFSKERQVLLEKIRQTIQKAAPLATETIAYGIPTFKLNGKNLAHFAGFKNHIGFYPTPNGIMEFAEELKPYQKGKGTMQFAYDKPIPWDLIAKIVHFRVKEITGGGDNI